MIRIEEFDNDVFKILVNNRTICKSSDNNDEVIACGTRKETKWNIVEKPKGAWIQTNDNFCIKKGSKDTRIDMKGYKLILDKCNNHPDSIWNIEDVDPSVYNGNLENRMGQRPVKLMRESLLTEGKDGNETFGSTNKTYNHTKMPEKIYVFF